MKCQHERNYLQVSHSILLYLTHLFDRTAVIFSGAGLGSIILLGECGALWGERERVVWSISVVHAGS